MTEHFISHSSVFGIQWYLHEHPQGEEAATNGGRSKQPSPVTMEPLNHLFNESKGVGSTLPTSFRRADGMINMFLNAVHWACVRLVLSRGRQSVRGLGGVFEPAMST